MSRYQSITAKAVQGSTVTIEVEEVHPDMWTIHDMLARFALGERAEVSSPDDMEDEGLFEVINGAAILMFSNHKVAQTVESDELYAEAFVRAVTITSADPIAVSSAGTPMYRALLDIELQDPELAKRFEGHGWDGYAYVMGDFDDMFF